MIVSHRWKFIFFKSKKTASTSVEMALEGLCGPDDVLTRRSTADERAELGFVEDGTAEAKRHRLREAPIEHLPNHVSAGRVAVRMDPETWASYHRFVVERNPWDKVISFYFFKNLGVLEPVPFDEFVHSDDLHKAGSMGIYTIKDELAVDRVVRYERLEEDLADVTASLGMPPLGELPRAKSKIRPPGTDVHSMYDAGTRARVAEVFAREIELFGYEFGG